MVEVMCVCVLVWRFSFINSFCRTTIDRFSDYNDDDDDDIGATAPEVLLILINLFAGNLEIT